MANSSCTNDRAEATDAVPCQLPLSPNVTKAIFKTFERDIGLASSDTPKLPCSIKIKSKDKSKEFSNCSIDSKDKGMVCCYILLLIVELYSDQKILQLLDDSSSLNDRVEVNVTKAASTTLASLEHDLVLANPATPTMPRVLKKTSKDVEGFPNSPNAEKVFFLYCYRFLH